MALKLFCALNTKFIDKLNIIKIILKSSKWPYVTELNGTSRTR